MKIEAIIKQQRQAQTRNSLPPLQKRVLAFFEGHRGEVFSYHDAEMLKELPDEKASALGWAMWALERKNFFKQLKVGRKTYFGLPQDIKRLALAIKRGENKQPH